LPGGLRGIGRNTTPRPCARAANLSQRLQHANLVVGGHDRNEKCAVGDRAAKLVEINEALRVDAERRDAAAFLFETAA
jgi:hypothetical protein